MKVLAAGRRPALKEACMSLREFAWLGGTIAAELRRAFERNGKLLGTLGIRIKSQ
jgi:hypothetical protein